MKGNTHGRGARLARNSIFSVIAWLSPIIVGFVTTPILVKGLGPEQYGVLAIVLGFLSYSFTFGTGKAAAKFVSEFTASGESEMVSQAVRATFWFSLAIGLLGAVVIAALANTIVSSFLLIPEDTQQSAVYSLYFACLSGLVMMAAQTFQYTLQGLHRFSDLLVLTSVNAVGLGVGNIILVLNGFGVVALLAWNLVIVAIVGILTGIQVRRRLPEMTLTGHIDRLFFRSVARYGAYIILFQIFGNILYIFERTWLARKFGSDGLTYYFVPMLLAIYMHGLIASFAQTLFPRINELLNDRPRLTALYQRATKLILAAVVFISACYISGGYLFLALWIGPDLAMRSYHLLIIHTVTFALVAIGVMSLQIAEAFRFPSLTAIVTGVWMCVAIPLMFLAAERWGSEGVALSRLVSFIVTVPTIFFVEKRFLGEVFWRFWLSAIARAGVAGTVAGIALWQIADRLPQTWPTLLAGGLVAALLFFGILGISGYLAQHEIDLIKGLIFKNGRFGSAKLPVE